MSKSVDVFVASVEELHQRAAALAVELDTVKALDDDSLISAQQLLSQIRRSIDACSSLVAGEVGHRSRRDLGYGGLAQRQGFRTPQELVRHVTGLTSRDSTTLVQVGAIMHEAQNEPTETEEWQPEIGEPWLHAVGNAVASGTLSIDAAKAIRSGLGRPSPGPTGSGVTVGDLADATRRLVAESQGMDADRLFKRARALRDDLDESGIVERESAIHQERALRRVRRPNGLSRYILDPDLEAAAFWDDLYDRMTSPRRGGPRFVDPDEQAWADAIATDERTTDQYMHDAVTRLLRIGIAAETAEGRQIVGSRAPAVRVLVSAEALVSRSGHGRIEGSDIPVSIQTVERIACTAGTIPIVFDDSGQAVNLGREQRLFSGRQRIALAARDGGCRWPDCERPPSWTEAHHIEHWQRDQGRTDLADGILLCRHHHMLLHNNHWEIRRRGGEYSLIPPPDVDELRRSRPMPSKSAALTDLLSESQRRRTRAG